MRLVLYGVVCMVIGAGFGFLVELSGRGDLKAQYETDVMSYSNASKSSDMLLKTTEDNLELCYASLGRLTGIYNDVVAIVNMQIDILFSFPMEDIEALRTTKKPSPLTPLDVSQPLKVDGLL